MKIKKVACWITGLILIANLWIQFCSWLTGAMMVSFYFEQIFAAMDREDPEYDNAISLIHSYNDFISDTTIYNLCLAVVAFVIFIIAVVYIRKQNKQKEH